MTAQELARLVQRTRDAQRHYFRHRDNLDECKALERELDVAAAAVLEGQDVSAAFDPMLAKIAAYGTDRAQAIARLREAMRETVALGTVTNAAYLERVLAHPQFASGDTHTGFLAEHA